MTDDNKEKLLLKEEAPVEEAPVEEPILGPDGKTVNLPLSPPTGFDMELRSLSKEELLERLESIRAEKAQRSVEKAAKTRSVTKRKKVGTLLDQLVKQLIEASPEERAKRLAELGLKEVKK